MVAVNLLALHLQRVKINVRALGKLRSELDSWFSLFAFFWREGGVVEVGLICEVRLSMR